MSDNPVYVKLDRLEEYDIRQWFMHADLEQALDTMNVITGIMEMRAALLKKRKRRSDAGQSRDKDAGSQGLLDG